MGRKFLKSLQYDESGNVKLTPIGELHKALMAAGMRDDLYVKFRPHLKVLMKSLGKQPRSIEVKNHGDEQTVEMMWFMDKSTVAVYLQDLPF